MIRTWLLFLLAFTVVTAQGRNVLVSSRYSNSILRYDAESGAFKGVFANGPEVLNPNGLAYGPDGNLYAGLGDVGVVLRLDGQTGALIDKFIDSTAFSGARAIVFGPDGDLYVAAGSISKILRFDGRTGELIGTAASALNLSGPVGLDIRADGLMAVGGALSNGVYFFRDGGFVRRCADTSQHGTITGVTFGPDGFAYAATFARNSILRFNPETCAATVFASNGGLDGGIYLAFGPDGELLVGSFNNDSVIEFDGTTGAARRVLVSAGAGGLDGTHDIAFVPEVVEDSFTPSLVLPGVARTAGSGGSLFRTTAWITNPADAPIRVRLRFRAGAGFQGGNAIAPAAVTIAAHETLAYADVLAEVFHVDAGTGGVMVVETEAGAALPVVSGRTFNDAGAAGTFGQYIVAVPIGAGGSEQWIHGLAANSANRTNVGVVNLQDAAAHATITLWNSAGVQVGNPIDVDVPALSSIQINGVQNAAEAGELDEFAVRVACAACAAYASKLDNRTSDPVCVIPNAERTAQWIDGVGATPGAGGTMWRSSLSLSNRGSSDATVRIAFTRRGETGASKTADVMVPTQQTRFIADLLPELFATEGAGMVALSSTAAVSAWARTFNDRGAAGTLGQFMPAFGVDELIGPRGAILQGLSENAAFRTNAGIVNTGTADATATLIAYDRAGVQVGTKSYTVRAGEALSVGRVLADIGVAPIADAHLLVTSTVPNALYVWASAVENTSTDQVFVRPYPLR